ncbi:MAG: hypothetical protein HOC23_24630 [Halieaceae bacterium]|jgi:TolB-like protein|nr:hypothetical protein [Halieaceae bacterium]
MDGLFAELKRRNVFRVGIAYLALAWVVIEVTDMAVPALNLPDSLNSIVFYLGIIGFPFALFFAWAFELTPQGLMKSEDVDQDQSVAHSTGRKLDFLVIALLAIAVLFMVWDGYLTPQPQPETPPVTEAPAPDINAASIAVLPFSDMSPDKDQAYFSDGISEELLNVLARIEGLHVASRTSAFSYKDSGLDIREIAGELGVAHVLEGSVRKAGNKVRITAQLIDTATDRHLWSDTYDRDLTDIFAVQDEIATAIVEALKETMGLEVAPEISVTADTANMSAYDLYLKGWQYFLARDHLTEAIAFLEEATRLDPKFTRAFEGLSATYSIMPFYSLNDRDYIALANETADKALALDGNLPFMHAIKAGNIASTLGGDVGRAIAGYDRAIALAPNNATILMWRGLQYLNMGYNDRAMRDFETCVALDPLYTNCISFIGNLQFYGSDIEKGFALESRARELGFTVGSVLEVDAIYRAYGRPMAVLAARNYFGTSSRAISVWMDALESPIGGPKPGLDQIEKLATEQGSSMEEIYGLLITFGAYDRVKANPFADISDIWYPPYAEFRRSPHFKQLIRDLGYDAYWRAKGFPLQCRAVGSDDFECD